MHQAERYYKHLKYRVKREGKPYDLLCQRGQETLFVEVKGTMSSGATILLTPNEKEQAFLGTEGTAELFVLREIEWAKDEATKLSGGKIDIYSRWKPDEHNVIPFQYMCDLDRGRLTKSLPVPDTSCGGSKELELQEISEIEEAMRTPEVDSVRL